VTVAHARAADPACGFQGFHLFPFDSPDATVAWASAAARRDNTDIGV
jgi:hypothetical protein